MALNLDTPPTRPETAGLVEEQEGDVDADMSAAAALEELDGNGYGGTPDDSAGESGADPG